jgi:hypothetical protein
MQLKYLSFLFVLMASNANADSSTLDAAIGGGIGGAAGAAIGNELGGRDGAIIGGAVGAAAGTAVSTEQNTGSTSAPRVNYESAAPSGGQPPGFHCPPGQRKKGRC